MTQRKAAIIAKEPALHGLLQQAAVAAAAAEPAGAGEEAAAPETAAAQPEAASCSAGAGKAAAAADGSGSSSSGSGAGAVHIDAAAGSVHSPCYSLAPVDLRDLGALEAAAAAAGFDTQVRWMDGTYVVARARVSGDITRGGTGVSPVW